MTDAAHLLSDVSGFAVALFAGGLLPLLCMPNLVEGCLLLGSACLRMRS